MSIEGPAQRRLGLRAEGRPADADLVHAVREALAGRRFLSPPLSQTVQAFLER